jgi:hypothetical protein
MIIPIKKLLFYLVVLINLLFIGYSVFIFWAERDCHTECLAGLGVYIFLFPVAIIDFITVLFFHKKAHSSKSINQAKKIIIDIAIIILGLVLILLGYSVGPFFGIGKF